MPLQDFWKITIVLLLEDDADENSSLMPSYAARNCKILPEIVKLTRESDPIGRTGAYIGVYGLFLRAGGFTATREADPVKGEPGSNEEGLCYDFITYAARSVTIEELSVFSDKIAAIHPWEHPTIEITDIKIWMPEAK